MTASDLSRHWPSELVPTRVGDIEVLTRGSLSERVLVFLHHGFGSAFSLWGMAQELGGGSVGIISYSRPGCGRSPPRQSCKEPDYLNIEATVVLPALLDAVGAGDVELVGHSDGGTIALLAGAAMPDRVKRITAIAPHLMVEQKTLEGVRALMAMDHAPGFRRTLALRHLRPDIAYESWRNIWLTPENIDWSAAEDLSRLTAPVQLIQGDEDEFGSLGQLDLVEQRLGARVEKSVIDGAGHSPHKTHPAVVKRLIRSFHGLPE